MLSINFNSIAESLEDNELNYSLRPIKIRMKKNMPHIHVGTVELNETFENDSLMVSRWIAETLSDLNLCEIEGEDFGGDLFKAFSREKIQSADRMSNMNKDIYLKMRIYLRDIRKDVSKKDDTEKILITSRDLLTLRTSKLLNVASSSFMPNDLESKITPEEKSFFKSANQLTNSWIEAILEEYS